MKHKIIPFLLATFLVLPTFADQIQTTGIMIGGDTDIHGCIPSAGYSWDPSQNACARPWEEDISFLSTDDQNTYQGLNADISTELNTKLYNATTKYSEKIVAQGIEKAIATNKRVLHLLETRILSERNTQRYNLMVLLKYKLLIIGNNLEKTIAVVPSGFKPGKVYSCTDGTKKLTVFTSDYLFDDMAFTVAKDEIHVSDGQFLLPNYVATRQVSASGEKFVGKDTETQEAVTFWFKNKELSMYRGTTLEATCSTVQ